MDNNTEKNIANEKMKTNIFGSKSMDIAAVLIAAAVGFAFSILVMKEYIGINLFLFSALAIAGVGYMLYKDDNLDIKNFAFFAGAFLVFASVFFRFKNEVFTFFAFPILISMLVLTTMYSSKKGAKKGMITYLFRQFGLVARVDKIFTSLSSFKKEGKQKNKKANQVLIGALISVGLLLVVIPLMMGAEAAFEQFIDKIIENIRIDFDFETFIGKSVAGVVIAILFCGFLYTFTKDKMIGNKESEKTNVNKDNHTIIITVLSIMGFVFLVFALIQFNSLFISKETIVENTTFAETARNGYFQLVVLSVINFVMVLMFTKMQSGTSKTAKNVIKILTTYFTVLNVYLLVSSAYKMTLYYDAYGLSVQRLLVYILLTYELIALAVLLIKIYKDDFRFFKTMVYITVGFWALVSLVNIEAWVAKTNIKRYEETGEIDMYYLTDLSADASGAISDLYFNNELCDEGTEQLYNYYFADYGSWINASFDIEDGYSVKEYEKSFKMESWLEYNTSKLNKYNDGLEVLNNYLDSEE